MFFQLIFAVFLMFSTLNGSYLPPRTLVSREGRDLGRGCSRGEERRKGER